jgi:hypothetical protein
MINLPYLRRVDTLAKGGYMLPLRKVGIPYPCEGWVNHTLAKGGYTLAKGGYPCGGWVGFSLGYP